MISLIMNSVPLSVTKISGSPNLAILSNVHKASCKHNKPYNVVLG